MTTRRPSNVTDAPAAAQAATPGAGEAARYAPAADLPDAATVARMANAFYTSPPSAPVPGPGAALPSAPVFAAEPMYNSLPGVPALATAAVAEPQSGAAAYADPGLGRGPTVSAHIRHRADARARAGSPAPSSCSRKAERPAAPRRWCPRCRRRRPDAGRRCALGTRAARHSQRRRLRVASLFAGRRDVAHSELR